MSVTPLPVPAAARVNTARPPRRLVHEALGRSRGRVGLGLLLLVAGIALLGPYISPHDPNALIATPFGLPSSGLPLGADTLGRDVLSRVLSGGRVILLESLLATTLGVAGGIALGMATGSSASRLSRLATRLNDMALALPQLVLILLVLTRIGAGPVVITLVVAAFHVPLTTRVIRAATLRVVEEDFIIAVQAMGVSRRRLLVGEILPNISSACSVEFGIRMAISIVTIASLGYLGFGGQAVDWGRMIYENQGGLTVQPWGVLVPAFVVAAFVIGISLFTDSLSAAARRIEDGAPDT